MELCLLNLLCFSLAIGLSAWIYSLSRRKHSYWSEKGISGPDPRFLFGNFLERLFSDLTELNLEWTQKYGPVFCFYQSYKPALMITDPELIKQITIRDFHHFVDRFNFPIYHEMWNQNLFLAEGEQWRRMRTIVSPTFTSGKLRAMHNLMSQAVHKLEQHLDHLIATKDGVMETKKVFYGFTIDVIASTVFALDTNANSDRPEDRLFVANGKRIFNFPMVRLIEMAVLPKFVLDLLGMESPFEPQSFDFFIKLTRHILSERRQQQSETMQKKIDFVQHLLDVSVDVDILDKTNYAQLSATNDDEAFVENEEKTATNSLTTKQQKIQLTDREIIANMIIFFTAGFEGTASTISHCIFALAHNPNVQERLYLELSSVLDKLKNGVHSEEYLTTVLTRLPFLEAVIKETLRLFNTVNELHRLCQTEGYQLGSLRLFKNEQIVISPAAVHLNPDYYPEPDRFKPERFLRENKHHLVPYTYLPFGTGPRNCIGMRFANKEISLCIARLVIDQWSSSIVFL